MPKRTPSHKHLKPYIFYGVNLETRDDNEQALGDCPFCGREGKFSVNVDTGLWRCYVCGEGTDRGGGNLYVFMRKLWDLSDKATKKYDDLAKSRKLQFSETLMHWGVCRSVITNEWLVPSYNQENKLIQLHKYSKDHRSSKMVLWVAEGTNQGIHGVNLYDQKKSEIFICEGPWDAMVLWETLRTTKRDEEGKLIPTANELSSLYATANVLAVPGYNTFHEGWAQLLINKKVYLLYDNDHLEKDGKIQKAAYDGMKRVSQLLAKYEQPPAEILFLQWGPEGYDPSLKHGYDVRDYLTEAKTRHGGLADLLTRISPIPEDWIPGRSKTTSKKGGVEIDCLECTNWKDLISAWRKAMKWIDGLDVALSVMLASVTSTKAVGSQLWVKVVSPPSTGKSRLCEALSVNKKYVKATSTMRGFHSGYRETSNEGEDNSLISQLYDKTLVTKDGDTLLQAPNKDQILSEARDIYDRTSRTHYRNKASKDYNGVNMTWILCGTSSLRAIDSSELGERFLDCVIMDTIDEDLEDEILWRVVNQAERSLSYEANGSIETQHEPEMLAAMQLTGGYVSYLRENAQFLLDQVTMPEIMKKKCVRLGKFVAYMRARPSTRQEESAEREFAARLVEQMTRLAKCLAVVLNTKETGAEVMRRVTKVALDTARGRTLELARHLHKAGVEGAEPKTLAMYTGHSVEKEKVLLRFLKRIGAAEVFSKKVAGISSQPRWKLSDRMARLYEEVMEDNAGGN